MKSRALLRPKPLLAAALVFLIGLQLAALSARWQERQNTEEANQKFSELAQDMADDVEQLLRNYEKGVRGLRGAVVAAGGSAVSREQILAYSATRDVDVEFPGARGFGVIWRVPAAAEAAYVQRAAADGWPGFAVKQLTPHAGERFVITYIEPVGRNRQAVGLDIASESNRRTAAETAMRTGTATLTAPITIVQATGKPSRAFLLLLPIYRQGAALGSAAQREQATLGWSYAPLVIDEVLEQLPRSRGYYTLLLRDRAETAPFYTSPPTETRPDALRWSGEFDLFGRRWEAQLQATPAFMTSLRQQDPAGVGLLVSGVSALLAALAYVTLLGAGRARQARLEVSRRAAIVASSSDAIIGMDLEGRVTEWNAAAERLFGVTADEAAGLPVAEIILPPERAAEDEALRAAAMRGESVPPFDSTRLQRDGTLIDVSVSAAPIFDESGRCIGLAKTLRDIRESRRAQRELAALNTDLERQVADRTARLDDALRDLRTLVDAVPSVIGYWDAQLINRIANVAYGEWTGHEAQRMPGRRMDELLSAAVMETIRPHVEAALRGEARSFETVIPGALGSERNALVHYLPDMVDGKARGFYVLAHDITEITRSRQALAAAQHAQEALLRTLDLHALVSVADPRGRIVSVNESFCRVSGYTREELLGQDHRILNSGLHERGFWPAVWQAISQGRPWRGEVCNRAKDGSLYWVDSVIAPILDTTGRIEKFVSIRTDITPLKRLQQQAEEARAAADESRRFLQALTDRLPLRIALIDADRRHRFANAAYRDGVEAGHGEVIGKSVDDVTDPAKLPAVREHVEAVLNGEPRVFELEEVVDGIVRIHESRLVPDVVGEGHVQGYFSLTSEITARRQAEDELRRTVTLLRSVLDASTQVSIIGVDPSGLVNIFNRGAEKLLGYTAEEVIGRKNVLSFHDREELEAQARVLSELLGREVPSSRALIEPSVLNVAREFTYRRSDGVKVPVSLAVTAMHDDRGAFVGYLGVAHDISVRQQYEQSLREAMQSARRANRAKSEFLANMSHEIRTPMNAVIGLSYLLGRTQLDGSQSATLAKIENASRSLLGIINDVLDLSKIEAQEMRLEMAPFDLRALVREVVDVMEAQADSKQIGLLVEVCDDLPPAVEGDSTRVRQVLTNLLSNAVKFTESGFVRLRVERLPSPAPTCSLRISVEDSGIGITPENQARLFQPFVQADTSTTRRFGGTGLGLSIVKQLLAMMNGSIRVDSEAGEGSTFTVELALPAREALTTSGPMPLDEHVRLNGVRLLVVDDSEINLEVARRVLELEGARVQTALDGAEALRVLEASPDAFDAVLMDLQMPVMDGLTATARIRDNERTARLPVIGLSAGVSPLTQRRAEAAGLNDLLGKPFDPRALVRCLLRHTNPAAAADASPKPVEPAETHWPDIAGIRIADVRQRLQGDLRLFAHLLRLMLAGNSDVPDIAPDEAMPEAELGPRLHRLKGTAGSLGAVAVERLAAQAEVANESGDRERALRLVRELRQQLQLLRAAAAAFLHEDEERRRAEASDTPTAAVDPQALAGLIESLSRNDLCAIDRFRKLAPQLRAQLGEAAMTSLDASIGALQFRDAANQLKSITAHAV